MQRVLQLCVIYVAVCCSAFSALTLLVRREEGHLACKKTEWWGAGVVIRLERGADLHIARLMPLPLTVCCFSKIEIGFTFLVPAHLGSPGQKTIRHVCVCVCVYLLQGESDGCSDSRCSQSTVWRPVCSHSFAAVYVPLSVSVELF